MATTDPQSELLTEVDSENNVIGPIKRGIAHHSGGKYYRCIYVIVRNRDGKILLQKRSATKDLYPNCWDLSVGGHVAYGDSYIETAQRELYEELGITAKENNLTHKGEVLVQLPESNEYFNIYEYTLKESDSMQQESKEISSIAWKSVDEIKSSMKTSPDEWYARPLQVFVKIYN